jgi:chondroitin-sulfate-ABC endolyase/exolyase
LFAMVLHDTAGDDSFWAHKSWFFFGDEVVCLGSNIANHDAAHATETTLFQATTCDRRDQPYYWNSVNPITAAVDAQAVHESQTIWMMDPYGTGYVVPDARGLHVSRGERDSVTHLGVPSRGYVTTAWLDHGQAPAAAEYEYSIVPDQTQTEISRRAAAPDYKVLRKDRFAHVVASTGAAAIGYVIFDPAIEFCSGAVMKASAPVLIYEKTVAPGQLRLSVADPDLRMGRTPTYASRAITPAEVALSKVAMVRLNLKGIWTIAGDAPPGVRFVPRPEQPGITTIEFAARDGRTFELNLTDHARRPRLDEMSGVGGESAGKRTSQPRTTSGNPDFGAARTSAAETLLLTVQTP